jgi:pyruvate dehydrogenase complex dehydrogenase (E1) component
MTALDSLSHENKIDKSLVKSAIDKYKIDPEKPNPVTV